MYIDIEAATASEFKITSPTITIPIYWTTRSNGDTIARHTALVTVSIETLILSPSFAIGEMVVMCITFVNGLYSGLDGA
jgi:hypothetical protein